MITLIELDGFKTFQKLKLELSPFQVVVGPNGAGKSNLFDALHLLSRLVDTDLRSAFQELRGNAAELFSSFSNGHSADKMSLAVEMLVDRSIQDSWGASAELKYTRMRYELEIARRMDEQGLERLYITGESLKAIPRSDDGWSKRHGLSAQNNWLPKLTGGGRTSFISTEEEKAGQRTIHLHQDGHGGGKSSVADKIERTVLSGVTNTEFPHAFAACQEMRTWKFLQLNPEMLRSPSSMLATPALSADGQNLAATIARMRAEDPRILTNLSVDIAQLVPGMIMVDVDTDAAHNQYIVTAMTQDAVRYPSRVLSDSTLRMLALVTLKNDPQHKGVLCIEEPENGVHPSQLKNIAHLLRGLTTNFHVKREVNRPLRQLFVISHSPDFICQPDTKDVLLFAYIVTRVVSPKNGNPPRSSTRIIRVIKDATQYSFNPADVSNDEENYTMIQIKRYLDGNATIPFGM